MIPLFWLNLADTGEVCGTLITESGDQIVTEAGDSLVTECFTPEAVTLRPGKVYRGTYPYWEPYKRPYYELDERDDEEVLISASLDLD